MMPTAMSAAIRLITSLMRQTGGAHPNLRIAMCPADWDACFKYLESRDAEGYREGPLLHEFQGLWRLNILGVPIVAEDGAPPLD